MLDALWGRWLRLRGRGSGNELKPVEGAFYVSGPSPPEPRSVVCHLIQQDGKTFMDTHHAEHDGIGYRVTRSTRTEIDLDAVRVDLAEILERKNMDIPGMEVLAAKLGSPGTDHQVARMKHRRDTVKAIMQLFTSLQTATKG